MLLTEGIQNQYVIPTDYTRKLTIDGHTDAYQVFKIRLDQLYYNDKNDRIATWINKYKEENQLDELNVRARDYNKIVQQFIEDSNPKALNKTKNNIKMVGQREAGVVLNDGRIIDGNRRYTCLNILHDETGDFNYFEAVILERDIDENQREIKLLELQIQHGEESKVDYNPIDKLVGLYLDVMKNQLITEEEYRKSTGETAASIKKKIAQAQLMVEFLEFIEAPEKFYIARDLELDGPLTEMPSILNKCRTEEEKEDVKLILFNNILMRPHSDITRFIRKTKNIVESQYLDEFIDEQLNYVEDSIEKLNELGEVNSQQINQNIRTQEDLKEKLLSSLEKYELKTKKDDTRTQPIKDLEKCKIYIDNIDINIVNKMSDEELNKLLSLADECLLNLKNLKDNLS